jgi:hypothetical protein
MARKKHIVKYTTEELDELVKKDSSRSDWKKAAGMTNAGNEAAIASGPDEADMVLEWDNATVELPGLCNRQSLQDRAQRAEKTHIA